MLFLAQQGITKPVVAGGGGAWTGPTTNLTNRWSLEDADVSGTTINANTGTITGTASSTLSSVAGPGTHTARDFNGTTQHITLTACPLPTSITAFTVAYWLYMPDNSYLGDGNPSMVGWQQSVGNTLRIINNAGSVPGRFYVSLFKGGVEVCRASNTDFIGSNVWTHFAVTWDGTSSMKLYINGSSVVTVDGSGNFGEPGGPSFIGCRDIANGGHYKGRFYNFVVYNAELNAASVTALYTAQ